MAERSNLPAPYQSPWRQLAEALQAVASSLRLDLRFLWRRNRDGTLPLPAFWPRDLAPLFWPLVGVAAIAMLLAITLNLGKLHRPSSPALSEGAPSAAVEAPPTSPQAAPPTSPPSPAPTPSKQSQPERPTPAPAPLPPAHSQPAASKVEPPADPLLQVFQAGDGGSMVAGLIARPEAGLLELQLKDDFDDLAPARQRRLAETWLEQSLQLGFEQLELRGGQGQRLGRRARVGSGMILLDPAATS